MELPHIGEHCDYQDCNKLDFLAIQCELCKKNFCNNHHKYEDHTCPESYSINVQVPICPLCNNPVPFKRSEPPDIAVNNHIINNCKVKKQKIYTNKCMHQGCKAKELVSIRCDSCQMNYCLRHRNPIDHDCKDPATARRELTLNGSIFNNKQNSKKSKQSKEAAVATVHPTRPSSSQRQRNISNIQGGLTEEEALARAMKASRLESQAGTDPSSIEQDNDEDLALAQAIAASLGNEPPKKPKSQDFCNIS